VRGLLKYFKEEPKKQMGGGRVIKNPQLRQKRNRGESEKISSKTLLAKRRREPASVGGGEAVDTS